MTSVSRFNAAPTITLTPPSSATKYRKRTGRASNEWKLIKRDPPRLTSTIMGLGGWYSSGEFRTAPTRVCLYNAANTFSLVDADKIISLDPSVAVDLDVADTICGENKYVVFDTTEFALVTPQTTIALTTDFAFGGVADVLYLPRADHHEYLVVQKDGTLIWVDLVGTLLVHKQTLATGIADIVAVALSFNCLDCASQRYTVQIVNDDGATTAFGLWRVNDTLSVASDSMTHGQLTGVLISGGFVLATDQVRLHMIGALTDGDVAHIFLFEPTKTNLYATIYYTLTLPLGDSIIHMETCNGVIDIILDNSGWIRIQNGKAVRYP